MIIIEGMDGSGKTTLFKQLSERIIRDSRFQDTFCLRGEGVPESTHEMCTRLNQERVDLRKHRILSDRSNFISDYVYGGYNTSTSLVLDLETIRRAFTDTPFRPMLIYCDPMADFPTSALLSCKATWEANIRIKYFADSPMRTKMTFTKMRFLYTRVMCECIIPDITYNWRMHKLEDVWKWVELYLGDKSLSAFGHLCRVPK